MFRNAEEGRGSQRTVMPVMMMLMMMIDTKHLLIYTFWHIKQTPSFLVYLSYLTDLIWVGEELLNLWIHLNHFHRSFLHALFLLIADSYLI
jgi:hypothetical protein